MKKLKSYSYNDAVVQKKVLNFLSKKKYTVTNQEEYMDNSFNKDVTNGEPLPQIKNIGILGTIFLRDIKSIQRKRSFKKPFIKAEIKRSIAARENLWGDQKKYPKARNKIKKVPYPAKETVSKKKLKKGVLIPSTQDKSFQTDIF